MFHIAKPEDIRGGKVTDVYFARTLEVLEAKGIDTRVRAEFFAKKLPGHYPWGVLAGIEEVAGLMEGRDVNIRSLKEGEVFCPWEPVMEVEGVYREFCVFETALLGLICQATGVATKAARIRVAAGDRLVSSFGARRMHPAIAPMIERSAYIGGCDGVAVIESAELIEEDPIGTMPHALILVMGGTVEAVKAFDEVIDGKVKRVALIDTFNDEKFESLRVAEAMGKKLHAVRLDTPATRRGDFYRIFEEVRWELDLRGFKGVKLFASGGLDEKEVMELKPIVDAFGVGTSISNAPVVDFSMDIIEVDGKPVAKRGKWSGVKDLLRCRDCAQRHVIPLGKRPEKCFCGGALESLFTPLMEGGKVVRDLPKPRRIREFVLDRIKGLSLD
ncbi:MAG: nicotinate phosphoribosyltransferase [Thermodesulfobacteriota bacterium]|nr:MAG: nicotinate phosphoribosyltransferase [Thermodesulfobacteriota bacterium]